RTSTVPRRQRVHHQRRWHNCVDHALPALSELFIYYKYNPEIRKQIRSTIPLLIYLLTEEGPQEAEYMKEPVVVMSVDRPETEPPCKAFSLLTR
ncbi:unnamed protein product, partial [Mesorhabditis spiculigera]